MYKMFVLFLVLIIKECQINGQAVISDSCQSQTSTINDLLMKVRQLETDHATLRQQNIEMGNKQKILEDELREIKIKSLENLRNKTDGK